jgi:hypothetical protein
VKSLATGVIAESILYRAAIQAVEIVLVEHHLDSVGKWRLVFE